jgi:3-hydroxybutyryl-CoA dehydratase
LAKSTDPWTGKKAQRAVLITERMLDDFIALSGDDSPIHAQDRAARARGFKGRVVHGAFLGALVSSVIGTQLPGKDGVLQTIELSFHGPCYIGDEARIEVAAEEFVESVSALQLKITILAGDGRLLAKGKARSGILPA